MISLTIQQQPLSVGWADALLASAAGFACLIVLYGLGLMGAADVKFAAALGLWIGPWPLMWVWIGASLIAGLQSIGLVLWRNHTGLPRIRKREIPYAAHMAVVTIGWLIWQQRT